MTLLFFAALLNNKSLDAKIRQKENKNANCVGETLDVPNPNVLDTQELVSVSRAVLEVRSGVGETELRNHSDELKIEHGHIIQITSLGGGGISFS